eukprot:g67057.t1
MHQDRDPGRHLDEEKVRLNEPKLQKLRQKRNCSNQNWNPEFFHVEGCVMIWWMVLLETSPPHLHEFCFFKRIIVCVEEAVVL